MTPDVFNALMSKFQKLTTETLAQKAKEYAKNDDRMWNFKEAARLRKTNPADALLGIQVKQIISVNDIVNQWDNQEINFDESFINEKLGDVVNYYFLLWAMCYERYGLGNNATIDDDSSMKALTSVLSIFNTTEEPKPVKTYKKRWTEEEINTLTKHYASTSNSVLSKMLNKTEKAIVFKANWLGLAKANGGKKIIKWDKESVNYLKNNYQTQSYEEIAKVLKRTPTSVERKKEKLGLKKHNENNGFTVRERPWSTKELNYMVKNYPTRSNVAIALELDRSEVSIEEKARRMKLVKISDPAKLPENLTNIGIYK